VGYRIPAGAHVFISVANRFKRKVIFPAKALHAMGYRLVATPGMARVLKSHGVPAVVVQKIGSGDKGIIEMIENGTIQLVVNMAFSRKSIEDDRFIRLATSKMKIPCITTMSGFHALVLGMQSLHSGSLHVNSIQDYNARLAVTPPAGELRAG
jgi:carbamoyl-phosphate synthase large subunit